MRVRIRSVDLKALPSIRPRASSENHRRRSRRERSSDRCEGRARFAASEASRGENGGPVRRQLRRITHYGVTGITAGIMGDTNSPIQSALSLRVAARSTPPWRRRGCGTSTKSSPASSAPHRSANASRTASAPKAAAKLRRSQASTRGRSSTWRRAAAANTP